MDFARQQRDPTRHVIGISFVVLMHVLVIWALLSGLGRTVVEVIKKPLTATVVEELKAPPPPPPPPKKIVEAPKVKPPPEVYVPPPDVPPPVTTEAPVITQVTPAPPTEPHVIAPPPPPAPVEPPKPAVRRGIQAQRVAGDMPEFPKKAIKEGVERGRVVARLNIDEKGNVTDVTITYAEPPRWFEQTVLAALKTWKFKGEGEKYVGEVEINFKLAD